MEGILLLRSGTHTTMPPITAAMYWFARTIDEIGPMRWGFMLMLSAAVIIVMVAGFLKN
jgi:hypothetical protein